MHIQPFIIKDLFDERLKLKISNSLSELKTSGKLHFDGKIFHRHYLKRAPFFELIHQDFILERACDIFKEKLKASYSYVSCYEPGKGFCPLHIDRSPCYRTIDYCVGGQGEWPLFVNAKPEHARFKPEELDREQEIIDKVKKAANAYVIKAGEALCYSGTDHPHWREKAKDKNYLDLIFFHFVPENFCGSLD